MFEGFTAMPLPEVLSFNKDYPDFRLYAIRRHGAQLYGDKPYAYHLAMVECILIEYGYSEYKYCAAAWLHDILEDTDTKLNHIYANYGPDVAALVYSVTGAGRDRGTRNACIYDRIKKHPEAAIVKVADRLANMTFSRLELLHGNSDTSKLDMYLSEWNDFRNNVCSRLGTSHRDRTLYEALDTLVGQCQDDLVAFKEDQELQREEQEAQKKGENTQGALSQGEEQTDGA